MTDVEIVVIGGGVMGSATAWQLARAGHEVVLLERFEDGHEHGASHGAARNFNISYHQPDFVRMIAESRRLWGELADESGAQTLDLVGLVRHGANPVYPDVIRELAKVGEHAEMLAIDEAQERWPQIRFDTEVLWCADAGRVRASESITAMHDVARTHGADIRHGVRVVEVRAIAEDRAEVELESGEVITAKTVVSTVGAWTSKLLSPLFPLPLLRVTQEQPAHFAPRDGMPEWPTFMHGRRYDDSAQDYWLSDIYGMLTPGEGVKAGWHGTGFVVDPDHRTYLPEASQLAALQRYAREWLPGVDADDFDPISCTYTTTRTEDFILDRVGPIVIGAGFSGQGFKFATSVGRMLADLATDATPAPERFHLPTGTTLVGPS
jgi:sarcosine oxidase